MKRLDALITVTLLTVSGTALAQRAPAPRAFEVTSIKDNTSLELDGVFNYTRGRFTVTNLPLRSIIQYAYRIKPYQLIDAPSWPSRYNIEATIGDPAATNDDMRVMLQNLLADRFGLRIRHENRQVQAYALVLARKDGTLGPNLVRVEADCQKLAAESAVERAAESLQPGQRRPPQCTMLANNSIIRAFQQPLAPVVEQLERLVGVPLVDQTGLTGNFDLTLRWEGPAPGAELGFDNMGALFTALRDQLGLKLEPTRADADVIVVTSVHRPTPN
jgi:uncharacterized protein (TIGR03435 family)